MLNDAMQILLQIFLILNIFFTVFIIFFERKNPASTWAWIIVLNILPYFGFIIYLMFGLEARKHKIFILKSKRDYDLYNEYLALVKDRNYFIDQQKAIQNSKNILQIPEYESFSDMVYMNYKSSLSSVTLNNKLTLFNDGQEKFDSLINDIENAQKFIHIQYYIFRDDELGHKILNLLTKKANEGLEVKLLIDGMGCIKNHKHFCDKLIKAGGKVVYFLPPYFFRVNFRNHRKICVIDGTIGYIGGFNIGDEYLGKSKKFNFWRDSHIKIYGDATKQLELRFIMDWNFCQMDNIKLEEKYFPRIQIIDCTTMQIVSSGPDTHWPSIQYNYFKMINEANKSIYIQTPYFIPEDSVLEALKIAALSGIDVRIIIPAKPDHPFVYWANLSYIGELLESGAKCYKYEKGFIHSKLILIDGKISSVGTANMDIRSFKLNFEINSIIYDKNVTAQFENAFDNDLENCSQIMKEDYIHRSNFVKIKESISRLFSPLL